MTTDGFLHRYFLNNAHKRIYKWMHYFDIYERHLARFRDTAPVMLEIGVLGGGSLEMWHEYLGSNSQIVGLDIDSRCKAHEADGIDVFIGSQDDPAVVDEILARHPKIDIVLDDGGHLSRQQIASFDLLYDRLSPNGVYIVEDTHTSYWDELGGGLERPGTFMEYVKPKLDEINAVHTRGAVPVSPFTRSTDSISIYDSVVVFERRPQGFRQAPITAAMPLDGVTPPGVE